MNICILIPPYKDVLVNEHLFTATLARYLPENTTLAVHYIKKISAYQTLTKIFAQHNYDVFFNFCDGTLDSTDAGIEVVQFLEKQNAAFTGANSHFFDPTRLAMKIACHSVGVKFPNFYFANHSSREQDLADLLNQLSFPMIVKPPHGASSIGIFKSSLVHNPVSLRQKIDKISSIYGSALVEEFIIGREFTVLVLENSDSPAPIVFDSLECVLKHQMDFRHYYRKWLDHHSTQRISCTDKVLNKELKKVAGALFNSLGGNGFARADIRVDQADNIFVLEINPNCLIYSWDPDSYSAADLILFNENKHQFFTNTLIELALKRQKNHEKKIKINFNQATGFHLIAKRNIAAGETVIDSFNDGKMNDYRLISSRTLTIQE